VESAVLVHESGLEVECSIVGKRQIGVPTQAGLDGVVKVGGSRRIVMSIAIEVNPSVFMKCAD
jgi:hypothetical protein